MPTATTSIVTEPHARTRTRRILRTSMVCALAATAANLLLWGIGRAMGAGFVVDPALGDANTEVDALKVVVTTLLPFAVGVLLVVLAARRSRRWVLGVAVAGAAVALASAVGPLQGAHDTATGVLLAAMHLTTGGAFVVAATRPGSLPGPDGRTRG